MIKNTQQNKYPIRKNNRLKDYDYSCGNWYFVTICKNNKIGYFGKIRNDRMFLNQCGEIVKNQWIWLARQYKNIELDEFVLMPNHVHGILIINESNLQTTCRDWAYYRRHSLLSKTINAFKTTSSKLIHRYGVRKFAWQRSFYDHVIRNEKSLYEIRRYIKNNPLQWSLDKDYVENM